jgi:hypothetical protein
MNREKDQEKIKQLSSLVLNNPSWRHGEFAEDDPFEDEFE